MSFLTPRLFAIAKMVDIEDVVADIGTDHAYLPIYLAKELQNIILIPSMWKIKLN
jgi:tRNA (adenine22-N1)-methyltransferase